MYGSLRGYLREKCSISSGNYLLPVQVGAPDYLSLLNKQMTCFYSIDTNNNKLNLSSDLSNIKIKSTPPTVASYLAGGCN